MLWEHILLAISLGAQLIGGMSMFLPPPRTDDSAAYRIIYAFCNSCGMNRGYARNATDPQLVTTKS
jgi:hypothetical protein